MSESDSESTLSFTDSDVPNISNHWTNFEFLTINAPIANQTVNRKAIGVYRIIEDVEKNDYPVWRNRFGFEISKIDPEVVFFDVCFPGHSAIIRIDERNYDVWILRNRKFELILDESIQFFFEHIEEEEKEYDHLIELHFHGESLRNRRLLFQSGETLTPRDPASKEWLESKPREVRRPDSTGSSKDLNIGFWSADNIPFTRCQSSRERPNFARTTSNSSDLDKEGPAETPQLIRVRSTQETSSAVKKKRGSRSFINQYMIEKTLATTGLGDVKLATDIITNQQRVIKIFERGMLQKKDKLFRPRGRPNRLGVRKKKSRVNNIKKEIEIMKNLDHPNIVEVIEVIDDSDTDQIYLVLEYINGGSLTDFVNSEAIGLPLCRCFARDLIRGLEYLHGQRVIHGDIKPDNLLIDLAVGSRPVLKLGDFGVSKSLDLANSFMSRIETTPAFQAPEELGDGGFRAWPRDIWSCGVVIYQVAFGCNPFLSATRNIPEIYQKIRTLEPEYPDMDGRLNDLIRRMLMKNPQKRITLPGIRSHSWITDDGQYPWGDFITIINENVNKTHTNKIEENESDDDEEIKLLNKEHIELRRKELMCYSKKDLVELVIDLEESLGFVNKNSFCE